VDWNADDESSLLLVLQELLLEYKALQQTLVDQHSRLQFEFSSLTEGGFHPQDIEVHVSRRGEVSDEFCFFHLQRFPFLFTEQIWPC
jgi:hypothetical protein